MDFTSPPPTELASLYLDALLCVPTAASLLIPGPGLVSNVLRVVVCRAQRAKTISAMAVLQAIYPPDVVRVSRNYDGAIYASFCFDQHASELAGRAYKWGDELVGFIRVRSVETAYAFAAAPINQIV